MCKTYIHIIENVSADDLHRLFKIILIHQKVWRFIRKLHLILAFLDAKEQLKCIVSFSHSAQSIILILINLKMLYKKVSKTKQIISFHLDTQNDYWPLENMTPAGKQHPSASCLFFAKTDLTVLNFTMVHVNCKTQIAVNNRSCELFFSSNANMHYSNLSSWFSGNLSPVEKPNDS